MGDCYVAVCGLPDPRKDHAVVMSRVARDCVYKMGILTKSLEVELGPDTGDLNIRIGLHRYVIEVRESTPLPENYCSFGADKLLSFHLYF